MAGVVTHSFFEYCLYGKTTNKRTREYRRGANKQKSRERGLKTLPEALPAHGQEREREGLVLSLRQRHCTPMGSREREMCERDERRRERCERDEMKIEEERDAMRSR